MSNNLAPLDPRVRRTRQLLQEALNALLLEKPLESITVRDIAGRATVNRATFYLHYVDKYDLVWQALREIVEAFNQECRAYRMAVPVSSGDVVPTPIERLFERFGHERVLLQRLLDRASHPSLAGQFLDLLERTILETPWPAGLGSHVPPMIGSRFMAGGLLCLIAWWLERPGVYSAHEMAVWYWRLIQNPLGPVELEAPPLTA